MSGLAFSVAPRDLGVRNSGEREGRKPTHVTKWLLSVTGHKLRLVSGYYDEQFVSM